MLTLTKIRELDLSLVPGAEQRYLSAASGLVRAGAFLYVVADDELHLGVFREADNSPGRLIRLFDGALPALKRERKKMKPDLEALAMVPAGEGFPHGAILALGSGSTKNRRKGALLRLHADGAVDGSPELLDLSAILAPLERVFRDLNIEGVAVTGGEVRLFQRGNKRRGENAVIRYALAPFLAALRAPHGTLEPIAFWMVDLGKIGGVPYSFTDAAALPDGSTLFTAIAEDTEDSYNDGPCEAAAIGVLDAEGFVRRLVPLAAPHKIEGVDARIDGGAIGLLLVTDADDPDIPASLFSATIEQ